MSAEKVCVKSLELVRPEAARTLGLIVSEPVFISFSDFTDSKPFVYKVGDTVKASYFEQVGNQVFTTYKKSHGEDIGLVHQRPISGIGYQEFAVEVMPKLHSVMNASWVALVEPVGTVLEIRDDYRNFNRVTDELTVREILVFCCGCYDGPLNRGFIVDIGTDDRMLYPICDSAIHDKHFAEDPNLLSPRMFFEIGRNHGVLIRQT